MSALRRLWWRVSGLSYGRHCAHPAHPTLSASNASWDPTGPLRVVRR